MANNNNSILFVDDEDMARKYFIRAFSKDFNILTASNVENAKKLLDEHSNEIGVLITDQRMPGDYGVVLLNYAKENYPHIVRLLTTAYSDLEDAIEAVNSGEILRYIIKPWDIKALHLELKHAVGFFLMRNERDQLIREKMNVWQRMTEINRVRDLLVMAGSFAHLNHSLQGVRSLLLQTTVTSKLLPEESSLELWGLLEDEVNKILTLVDSVKTATQTEDGRFLEMSIADLLKIRLNNGTKPANFEIGPSDDWPLINGCPDLMSTLFDALRSYFIAATDDNDLQIIVTGDSNDNGFTLNIKPAIAKQSEGLNFDVNKDLLVAFLIAAHHGGEIILNQDNPVSVDLKMRLGVDEIVGFDAENNWLDEIFSRYET